MSDAHQVVSENSTIAMEAQSERRAIGKCTVQPVAQHNLLRKGIVHIGNAKAMTSLLFRG